MSAPRTDSAKGAPRRTRSDGGAVPVARGNTIAPRILKEYRVRIPRDPALKRATELFQVAPARRRSQKRATKADTTPHRALVFAMLQARMTPRDAVAHCRDKGALGERALAIFMQVYAAT